MTENEISPDDIVITAVCGSLRAKSYTRMALEIALAGAREIGVITRMVDLREYELAFCGGKEAEKNYPPGVFRLRQDLRKANGLILGTPEYHGSYSGVLKNALDLAGFKEFEGKMIGLIGVSGGLLGATNALNDLRSIGRALHAWVIPEQVAVPEAWKHFMDDGSLTHDGYRQRLRTLGKQVAKFSLLHTSDHAMAFLKEWENAPVNPGG